MIYLNPFDLLLSVEFEELKSENIKDFKEKVLECFKTKYEIKIHEKKFIISDFNNICDFIEKEDKNLEFFKCIYEQININAFFYGAGNFIKFIKI